MFRENIIANVGLHYRYYISHGLDCHKQIAKCKNPILKLFTKLHSSKITAYTVGTDFLFNPLRPKLFFTV